MLYRINSKAFGIIDSMLFWDLVTLNNMKVYQRDRNQSVLVVLNSSMKFNEIGDQFR